VTKMTTKNTCEKRGYHEDVFDKKYNCFLDKIEKNHQKTFKNSVKKSKGVVHDFQKFYDLKSFI
jgi:hypothetical protein